ncbi:hypothetical protein O998_04755 [Anaplasma phagocytophilum str. Norway variant1]|uniref:Uncharacterized protein n=1 Tax=Anaplasma phagocytophilum str. Norway variant1 TaxID=1392506 RepID=A0A7H9DZU4_ANAPH|nr:hypothetical protein [Anaplasma phagocytophilum]QLL67030.1 hypothetical protein O998_04755 [Anaplasma phagocytophilum str. Norway variant1]
MEISAKDIDGKVCKTQQGHDANSHGWYAKETTLKTSSGATSICGGKGKSGSTETSKSSPEVLRNFVATALLGDGSNNWPTSTAASGNTDKPKPNDNAKAVATDLVALNPEEKTIVAGLLAKTIEGGEVVEIRAVSSTSVRN